MSNEKKISIFEEQVARKPDYYPWAKEFIKSMWHSPWNPDDFNFKSDVQDYKVKLNDNEREIIQKTLSAIAQIEVAVKTFWAKLGDNLPQPAMRDLGCVMSNVETIHNHAYEKLLCVLGLEHLFEENLKLPVIAGRVNYLRKYNHKIYTDEKKQYIYALILFTLYVENVSLFSQFYIIDWFNRYKNVLKDTSQQTKYTRNEETIHSLVGITIINTIRQQHPEYFDEELINRVKEEAKNSVIAEANIIEWILGNFNEEKLNKEVLDEFIKNRMNDSLEKIGFGKLFEINENLLKESTWFDEEVYGNNSTDFFWKRPVEYSKSHTTFNEEDMFE